MRIVVLSRIPLKVRTIEYLELHRDHPCAVASREIAETYWMGDFYEYAILLDRTFALRGDAVATEHGKGRMRYFKEKGYSDLLQRFYKDTEIILFWDRTDDLWREVQLDCHACLQASCLKDFLGLFFGESPYRMVFVPNPLDPPTFGFGLNDGMTAYCTFGPPTVPLDREDPVSYASFGHGLAYAAFHEFAHSLLNRALERHSAVIDRTQPLEATMALRGWFPKMYETWDKRFGEIFIRAATALYCEQLEGEAMAHAMLEKEIRDFGIGAIDPIFSCLREYLSARRHREYHNLGEYLPSLSDKLMAIGRP